MQPEIEAAPIRPLYDRMFVRPIYDRQIGLIHVPESAHGALDSAHPNRPQRGIVLAIGEGEYNKRNERKSVDVKVGDEVYFVKLGGDPITLNGEEVLVMCEGDVLGVVERTDEALPARDFGAEFATQGPKPLPPVHLKRPERRQTPEREA